MIRFKCIYCGQRILAPDNGAGKKGYCPKCQHELRVPKTTKGRPAISSDKEPMPERPEPYVPEWEKDLRSLPTGRMDELTDLNEEISGFLIPTYDELSLFLMAATLILLYVGNSQIRSSIHYFLTHAKDTRVFVLGLVFLFGLCLCLYHVFTRREKTNFEKSIMMLFAVATNAGTGIISGWYVIKNSAVHNWLLVFPIWNIINGIMLLAMFRFRIIDERCISDRDATAGQVILGLIAVFIIFIFCNFVFKLYWAITFSICIVYTTSFDKALQSVFPGIANRGDEQNA